MPIISASKNDIGRNRKRANEDYIWIDDQVGLYIVADGMGGQEAGEVASEMAATTVAELMIDRLQAAAYRLSSGAIRNLMIDAIESANTVVYQASQDAGHRRGMGTTIVMALVQPGIAYISHAGDSRAYLVRAGSIVQLTEDDSWANFGQKNLGSKTKIAGHILTKAVGQNTSVDPSFTELPFTLGDTLLLCSDGLWNMLEDELILAELVQAGDRIDQAAEALVAAANAAGGKDNISVVIIKNIAPD